MTAEQLQKFYKFIIGDDLDFYEEYTIHLSDEEQEEFFRDNPDFMKDFPMGRGKIDLLKDEMYRGILRKIKMSPPLKVRNKNVFITLKEESWKFADFRDSQKQINSWTGYGIFITNTNLYS